MSDSDSHDYAEHCDLAESVDEYCREMYTTIDTQRSRIDALETRIDKISSALFSTGIGCITGTVIVIGFTIADKLMAAR